MNEAKIKSVSAILTLIKGERNFASKLWSK